jgi:large subunit ribosomal protein L21
MKRVARIAALLAGIVAIIWAMRDRFISLALPREPTPPAFRHMPPSAPHRQEPRTPDVAATSDENVEEGDDLTAVKGIGAVYSGKLAELGITSFASLAAASAEEIAQQVGTQQARVESWIRQAGQLS